MAWDFSTDPEFQAKLDWVEQFCKEEVEPLEYVFPYAVRSRDPKVKAYVRGLQQQVKDQGLWALFLDEELGGPGYGQLKLGLARVSTERAPDRQREASGCEERRYRSDPSLGNSLLAREEGLEMLLALLGNSPSIASDLEDSLCREVSPHGL